MSDGRGLRDPAAPIRSQRQRRLERAALAAVALLALASIGWAVDRAVAANESEAADHRLARSLDGASGALDARVRAAAADARRLAASPSVQRAVVARDGAAVGQLLAAAPSPTAVYAGGSLLGGRVRQPAIVRSAAIGSGPELGRVVTFVPLDRSLVHGLEAATRVRHVRLVLVDDGRAVAGPARLVGERLDLSEGKPAELSAVGREYRGVGVRILGAGRVELGAVLPSSLVDTSRSDRRRVLFAILATLATLVLVAFTLPDVLRRYRGRPNRRPRERRRPLGPRSSHSRPTDARDAALALVGEALAATHDPQALLPVIVGASIEATGAVGARLVEGGREIAAAGDPDQTAQPLRLRLGSDEADDSTLLLYPPPEGFREDARELAGWLAAQASIALENARLHGLVKAQAVTDELTSLANRRRFMEVLALELKRAERFGSPLALVLVDLDDFKSVNDRFGHLTGDDVLRALSRVLRSGLRDVDLPARVGGEEFALLLPETDMAGAEGLAERLRGELADLELQDPEGGTLGVTASFGVAVYPHAQSGDELLSAADAALYQAKAEGKNRVAAALST